MAREAARGLTSPLLAPAALLAAALLVAVGGSGADALTSLGQLAHGPDVPLSSVDAVSRGASAAAHADGLDSSMLATSGAAKPRARGSASSRDAERLREAASGSSGPRPDGGSSGGGRSRGGSGGARTGAGGGTAPGPASPGAPSSGRAPSSSPAPSSPSPNPVEKTLDQTEQQLDKLLKPVKPITDGVLGGLGR